MRRYKKMNKFRITFRIVDVLRTCLVHKNSCNNIVKAIIDLSYDIILALLLRYFQYVSNNVLRYV